MEKKDTLVVVMSRNYSTGLSVIRSLGTEGYTVDLVASAPREGASDFIAKSRFLRKAVEVVAPKLKDEDDPALVEALLQYRNTWPVRPVIIAADDYTASVMDLHRDELSDIFVMPQIVDGVQGTLTTLMDKSIQGEMARQVGIKTPQEWVVSLRNEDIDISRVAIYPCYVKPLGSIIGYKQEMARCDDPQALVQHLQKLREFYSNRSVLVQEFMNIDEEYDIEGICVDQDIYLFGVIWKERVAQYDKGVPLAGKTFSLDMLDGFLDKVYALLKAFHYVGMFDLGVNYIDGEFYFNEINLRSGGTNYVYYKSGVNLSDLFVRAALGEDIFNGPRAEMEFGKTYLYEKVAWDDFFHGYLPKEELDERLESAEIKIINDDMDPEPAVLFNEQMDNRLRNKQIREKCVAETVAATGWTEEEAQKRISSTRQRLGISYREYRRHKLWQYPPEEQEEAYRASVERQERIRMQREECIAAAMEGAGWTREEASEEIRGTRERFDVSYNNYKRFELWKYPHEEQEEAYIKGKERRERIRQQREACIESAMELAGWNREYAKEQIADARARLGITYNGYRKHQFCLIPVEEQQAKYDEIQKAKAKK